MKERFSKILLTSVLSVLLGASMGQVSADQAGWSDNNVVVYDQGLNNNCFTGNNGWLDGCCDYNCCNDPCFSLAFDWLYWDIVQEDMDVGIADFNTAKTDMVNANTQYFNYRYKSGFRFFASYHLPCNDLSLDFVYTYFHPRYSNKLTAPRAGSIASTHVPATINLPAQSEISTGIKLKYDMYDSLVSKTIRCGECTKIRPYAGFRALVFRQQVDNTFTPLDGPVGSYSNWYVNYPAYGFTIGAEGKWCFCNNVSVIGRLGASLLGGSPKHRNQWHDANVTSGVGFESEWRKHSQVVSGRDGAIGLAYDTECCCMPVDFAVGYEFQDWWNTAQRPRFVSSTGDRVTGDSASRFTVHGLFVRAGIGF